MFETVAWLGLLFFLLVTGLEIDFSSAWRQRGDALKIALSDIVVPMAIAFIPAYFLPDQYLVDPDRRMVFALFLATVMTISAMPIAARALVDLNLYKTDLGFLIMSALSVNDIIGWLIFTMILGVFTQATLEIKKVFLIFSATLLFVIFSLSFGRILAQRIIIKIKEKGLPEPATSLTFICLLGIFCGAVTQKIGIHALFGFFIAGIVAGEAREFPEKTRQIISQMVYAVFVPLFFVSIGLKVDFLRNFDIFLILLISVVGIGGRFLGAWLGTRFSSVAKVNRLSVAIAHTPGGSMEIVIGILALEFNLITEPVFVAIVFGAVLSSVILGPWLAYSFNRRKEISILESFSKKGIISHLDAVRRDEAIAELCELAVEQDSSLRQEVIYKAVLERENLMGTALENGVAVPHGRIPGLLKPVVVFGRSAPGIEWDSPDGQDTHLIFLILTPKENDDIQVQILRVISRMTSDSSARQDILEAEREEQTWDILAARLASQHIVRS
jgi:Kef-type K+ transport system membrane component KefB/mannitol/fructose-specific phosphotransferase system IIA component (Ntr-type)